MKEPIEELKIAFAKTISAGAIEIVTVALTSQ